MLSIHQPTTAIYLRLLHTQEVTDSNSVAPTTPPLRINDIEPDGSLRQDGDPPPSSGDGSHSESQLSRKVTTKVYCLHCGKIFVAYLCHIARGRGKFCSVSCSSKTYRHLLRTPSRPGSANPNWRGGHAAYQYTRKYKRDNPEKASAHRILYEAIVAGKLVRPDQCSRCEKHCKPDGHHEDYSKPLKVQWICRKCHVAADRERRLSEAAKKPIRQEDKGAA